VLVDPVAVPAGGDVDFLDPQVARDGAVAAGAGEGGGRLGVGRAELLGVDVVPAAAGEVAAVPAEAKPRSATHTSRDRFHPARSSFTIRMMEVSAVSPGKVQHRTGTPSRVTAIAITTCGRSSRRSLECPNRRVPASVGFAVPSSPDTSCSSARSSGTSSSKCVEVVSPFTG
jgi:hypothetical protein